MDLFLVTSGFGSGLRVVHTDFALAKTQATAIGGYVYRGRVGHEINIGHDPPIFSPPRSDAAPNCPVCAGPLASIRPDKDVAMLFTVCMNRCGYSRDEKG